MANPGNTTTITVTSLNQDLDKIHDLLLAGNNSVNKKNITREDLIHANQTFATGLLLAQKLKTQSAQISNSIYDQAVRLENAFTSLILKYTPKSKRTISNNVDVIEISLPESIELPAGQRSLLLDVAEEESSPNIDFLQTTLTKARLLVEAATTHLEQKNIQGAIDLYEEGFASVYCILDDSNTHDEVLRLLSTWKYHLYLLYKNTTIQKIEKSLAAFTEAMTIRKKIQNKNNIDELFLKKYFSENSLEDVIVDEKLTLFDFLLQEALPFYCARNNHLFSAIAQVNKKFNPPQTPSQHYERGKCYFDLTKFYSDEEYIALEINFFKELIQKDWKLVPLWQKNGRLKLQPHLLEEVNTFLNLKFSHNTTLPVIPPRELEQQVRSHIEQGTAFAAEKQLNQCIVSFNAADKLLYENHRLTSLNAEIYYEFSLICLQQNRDLDAFEALCTSILSYPIHAKALYQRSQLYLKFAIEFANLNCTHLKDEAQRKFFDDANAALKAQSKQPKEALTKEERAAIKKLLLAHAANTLIPKQNTEKLEQKTTKHPKKKKKDKISSASTTPLSQNIDEKNTSDQKPKTSDVNIDTTPSKSTNNSDHCSRNVDEKIANNESSKKLPAKLDQTQSKQTTKNSDEKPSEEQKELSRIKGWHFQIIANAKKDHFDDPALTITINALKAIAMFENNSNPEVVNYRTDFQIEQIRIYRGRASAAPTIKVAMDWYQEAFSVVKNMVPIPEKLKTEIENEAISRWKKLINKADKLMATFSEKADKNFTCSIKELYQQAQIFGKLFPEATVENDHIQKQLLTLQASEILKEIIGVAEEAKQSIDSKLLENLSKRMLTLSTLTHQNFTASKTNSALLFKMFSNPRAFEIFIQLPQVRQRIFPELANSLDEKIYAEMLVLPHNDYYQVSALLIAAIPYPDLQYPQPSKNAVFLKLSDKPTAKLLESWDPHAKTSLECFKKTAIAFDSCVERLHPLLYPKYGIEPNKTIPAGRAVYIPLPPTLTFTAPPMTEQSLHPALAHQAAYYPSPISTYAGDYHSYENANITSQVQYHPQPVQMPIYPGPKN